jgi:hypothetical protein
LAALVAAGRCTTVGVLLAAALRSLPLTEPLVLPPSSRVQRSPRRPLPSPCRFEEAEEPVVEVEAD